MMPLAMAGVGSIIGLVAKEEVVNGFGIMYHTDTEAGVPSLHPAKGPSALWTPFPRCGLSTPALCPRVSVKKE